MLFTQFTVDKPKLTVNGSVLSDTPNVRYLVALYQSTNYLGTINVIQSTGKKMVAAGNGGSIVNISRYVSLSYSFYIFLYIWAF